MSTNGIWKIIIGIEYNDFNNIFHDVYFHKTSKMMYYRILTLINTFYYNGIRSVLENILCNDINNLVFEYIGKKTAGEKNFIRGEFYKMFLWYYSNLNIQIIDLNSINCNSQYTKEGIITNGVFKELTKIGKKDMITKFIIEVYNDTTYISDFLLLKKI